MSSRLQSSILILLFVLPLAAHAREPVYSCSVTIAVRGDAKSFWIWGTDTWKGEGIIECYKSDPSRWNAGRADTLTAPVFAKFEGWGPGYGATGTSEIILSLEGFELADIQDIYGSYRALGATARLHKVGGQFILMTQNATGQFVWSVTPGSRAVNVSAFMQFGQLVLSPSNALGE